MTLELEGNILLERAHTRRWVSIIAVVIPVAAFVMLSAWFIRAYIAPPTVAIPSPMMLAAAAPPAPPSRAQSAAAKSQPVAVAEPAQPPLVTESPTPVSALPMFATLAVAPPSAASAPPAFADPAQDASPAASPIVVDESAALEPSEPIAGPIPLPRVKPHGRVALVTGLVPLPRPRPAENAPAPDLPVIDRHAVE